MEINKTKMPVAFLCALLLLVAAMFCFSGCGTVYTSVAGTLEDMAGTYQLTAYTQKDADDNKIDRITQLHVKAYIVVGSDGYGYYVYQDDNTELWYDSIFILYNKDTKDESLYKSIRFSTGRGEVKIDKQKPGCGYEPTMGFNVNTQTFNYFIPDSRPSQSWILPSYYTDVVYTKVSTDTTLGTVATALNTTFAALPRYELKNLNGALIFHAGRVNTEISSTTVNPEYDKYKYYVINFNAVTQKADIYYELIAGSDGAQVEENVQIDVSVVRTTDENYTSCQLTIKLFDKDFVAFSSLYSMPTRYLNHAVNSDPDENGTIWEIYNDHVERYVGTQTNINDIVAEQLEAYNNSLS